MAEHPQHGVGLFDRKFRPESMRGQLSAIGMKLASHAGHMSQDPHHHPESLATAEHVVQKQHHDEGPWSLRHLFHTFAQKTSYAVGTPWAFLLAMLIIIVWAVTGPIFGFSDTWQLVINTGTTIVTFLMVFLIQNTQNRDAKAIHLKLDELIRAKHGARNKLVDLEDCTDEELEEIEREFQRVRRKAERDAEYKKREPAKTPH
jgi:low affinity Fe/Cu permease